MAVYQREVVVPRPHLPGGREWRISGLNGITVLFGKNGAGKSVLLRSWRDRFLQETHYVAPERTGDMNFEPVLLATQGSPEGRRSESQRNFSANYRQQIVARITSYLAARGAHKGERPGNPLVLERLINVLMPDFEIQLVAGMPPFELVRVTGGAKISNIDELSSGEAQILSIGLDILTISAIWDLENKPARVVLIDEPDAHIHPDLQVRFADFLVQVSSAFGIQIVLATHSTTLLAALGQFGDANTSTIYLTRDTTEIAAKPFDSLQKEIAACLGGHALMGPLFGAPLLLVEGDDDYRIWSQVPRHHKINLAVIPSNGDEIKRYQQSLEKLFAAVTEPRIMGFAVLDGDKGKPTPSDHHPQNFVRYIQLRCHEAENLYLSDEVLGDLGHSWETASRRIVEEADRFGGKAAALKEAGGWDRQDVDLKGLMEELMLILDKKNVHWTVRVGRGIGLARPSGHLAELLGEEVVRSLWGVRASGAQT
jgi:hypothetical protein